MRHVGVGGGQGDQQLGNLLQGGTVAAPRARDRERAEAPLIEPRELLEREDPPLFALHGPAGNALEHRLKHVEKVAGAQRLRGVRLMFGGGQLFCGSGVGAHVLGGPSRSVAMLRTIDREHPGARA